MPFEARFSSSPPTERTIRKIGPQAASRAIGAALPPFAIDLTRILKVQSDVGGLKVGTGDYRRGWIAYPRGSEALIVINRKGYAVYVEDGTKPHLIKPRRKPFLAWRTGGRGPISAFRVSKKGAGARSNFIYTARPVRHPGTKAYRIFGRTWDAQGPRFGRYLFPELRKELTSL